MAIHRFLRRIRGEVIIVQKPKRTEYFVPRIKEFDKPYFELT